MELNLDLSLVRAPETMSELLRDVSGTKEKSHKLSKLDDYVKRLEDEMRKIDGFKRELPLSMLLLKDAIDRMKEEAMQCAELKKQTKVEELMALKENMKDGEARKVNDSSDKKDWMNSVQLWSSDNPTHINFDHTKQDSASQLNLTGEEEDHSASGSPIQVRNHRISGGAVVPIRGRFGFARTDEDKGISQVPGLSILGPNTDLDSCNLKRVSRKLKMRSKSQNHQPKVHPYSKQRRNWSPELHRLFVEALKQLGGSKAATPKLIRQVMQVDGLTNDEIKSHLQKYRLHLQRAPCYFPGPENRPWMSNDPCSSRDSNANNSRCDSPPSPLASGCAKDISTSGADNMGAEEDDPSDGCNWSTVIYMPRDFDPHSYYAFLP